MFSPNSLFEFYLKFFELFIRYRRFGTAEGLICMTSLDDDEDVICNTQGYPISPADEVRIVDAEDRDVPPGEAGELLSRGPYTIQS